MKLGQESYGVSDLVQLVRDGKLALPEFQRPYVWPPGDIAELLRAIARRWPVGTFLLLRLDRKAQFQTRRLEGAPPLRSPSFMILDGQQRMTALYRSLTDRAEETYYVNLRGVVHEQGFDDEHLRYEKRARFVTRYPGPREQVEAGVLPVSTLWGDREFADWVRFIAPEREQKKYWEARASAVGGLTQYEIPCVVLPANVELAALAKIFEDINRRGRPLKPFHLMVAKLYPHSFRLRDRSEQALARHEMAKRYFGAEGEEVFGMEVLKLVALREHLRQRRTETRPYSVRGVRESDVMDLDPRIIKRGWAAAVKDYVAALKFARDRCGAVRPAVLPARAMLLPMADSLASGKSRYGWLPDLERWFWASCFDQTYAQGANTQAIADAMALAAWQYDRAAVPETIRNFTGAILDELLIDRRPRNEMLVRGILCLLTKLDSRDWIDGDRIRETGEDLEIHHCFAENYTKKAGDDHEDVVVNFAYIKATTNAKIRDESPSHVANRRDVSRTDVQTHAIDYSAFRQSKWEEFKTKRAESLKALILEAVKPA